MGDGHFWNKKAIVPAGLLILALAVSCKTAAVPVEESRQRSAQEALLPAPKINVSPYQEAVYTGSPLPITASCDQGIPLIITYYTSIEDYHAIQRGFYDAPAEPGVYYVSVNCAPGYGYSHSDDQLVEFTIKKAPVQIIADDRQTAAYNGSPRRVQASAIPDVPLSYSYYPNPELLQAAVDAFLQPDDAVQSSLSSALRNFTRVERAPVEQGVYYVLVYFPGDDRYEPVYRELEFTIGPAVPRTDSRRN